MLPNPYVIAAAVFLTFGALTGVYLMGRSHERTVWEAATAKLSADAERTLTAETAKVAALDQRNAELANELDKLHAQHLQDDVNRGADFDRELAKRVRDAERRARRSCPQTVASADTSINPNPSPGGDDGFGGVDTGRIRAVRDAALKLQEFAKTCHAWAHQVGR